MNERPTLGCLWGCGERAGEEDAKSSPALQACLLTSHWASSLWSHGGWVSSGGADGAGAGLPQPLSCPQKLTLFVTSCLTLQAPWFL